MSKFQRFYLPLFMFVAILSVGGVYASAAADDDIDKQRGTTVASSETTKSKKNPFSIRLCKTSGPLPAPFFASLEPTQRTETFYAIKGRQKSGSIAYHPLGKSDELRSNLDNRTDGFEKLYKLQGGFFEVIEEGLESPYCTSHEYTLSKMKKLLEALGLNFTTIQTELAAFNMTYVLSKYFELVENPQEGDLLYYEGTQNLSGIYTSSSQGWTVLVKLYFMEPVITQRDFFLLPSCYGNIAKFYRVKSHIVERTYPCVQSMAIFNGNTFVFDNTPSNRTIRDRITKLFDTDLLEQFTEIRRIPIFSFQGVCSNYAFTKIAGTNSTPVGIDSDNHGEMLEKTVKPHFSITTSPTKGDLVAYFDGIIFEKPVHWGVYIGSNYVESKWGKDWVYEHPIFYVDNKSGDYVRFYRRTSTPTGWPALSTDSQVATSCSTTSSSASSH